MIYLMLCLLTLLFIVPQVYAVTTNGTIVDHSIGNTVFSVCTYFPKGRYYCHRPVTTLHLDQYQANCTVSLDTVPIEDDYGGWRNYMYGKYPVNSTLSVDYNPDTGVCGPTYYTICTNLAVYIGVPVLFILFSTWISNKTPMRYFY